MSYEFWGRHNRFLRSFTEFANRRRLGRLFTYFMIFLAATSGIATYYIFSTAGFEKLDSTSLILILNLDLVVFLILALIIIRKISKVWMARKSGQVAAKLHTRFVILSSLLTITPAIVMTIFSALMFNMGLQKWFSDRVSTALEESTKVAESYLEEPKKVIVASVYNMARDLAQEFPDLEKDTKAFSQALDLHAETRNLDEALVFNGTPEVIAKSKLSFALEFEILSLQDLEQATRDVVIKTTDRGDRVRALVKIAPNIDAYLLVGRIVDPVVSKRISEVKSAVSNYHDLEKDQGRVQLYFMLMFMVVALLLLLTAIWVALIFAGRIARPIGDLINASEKVRQGDLSVRVTPSDDEDEIAYLMRSYNRMTAQLDEQQQNLVTANKLIDLRRRFIEEVLEGVTSGVLSLDHHHIVQVVNKMAVKMLSRGQGEKLVERPIQDVFPELMDSLLTLDSENRKVSEQLKIPRQGALHTLRVSIVLVGDEVEQQVYIITFDEITALLSAQRKAAWADVARRIAHEIRNPLTPIQLSAERLNRKYLKQITEDKEKFEGCVETIIRQVTNIGDMVTEFSNFARLPDPKLKTEDLIKLMRQQVEQQREAEPTIKFEFKASGVKTYDFNCDGAQISQVLTNLLQNAIDSLHEYYKGDHNGKITVVFEENESNSFSLLIKDNGAGFPKEDRDSLTEPYITKKEKGTGLGLAIVKKIVEDHGGVLTLEDAVRGGAIVRMKFFV